MNAILEAMEKRRSVRKYKPDMVPQDAISSVISAGLYAASGMNRQDTIIIAVTTPGLVPGRDPSPCSLF